MAVTVRVQALAALSKPPKAGTKGVNPYTTAPQGNDPQTGLPWVLPSASQRKALQQETQKRNPKSFNPSNLPSSDWSPTASPSLSVSPPGPSGGPAYTEGEINDRGGNPKSGRSGSAKTPYIGLKGRMTKRAGATPTTGRSLTA